MGWQDSLAKHHPIPAFFAAVISNIITGNKAENANLTDTNSYNEPASSDNYAYGSTDIQPDQYYYPPTPIPSSSSLNKPKKARNKKHDESRPIGYYNDMNDARVARSKGFWGRKNEHVVEKRKGYEENGTVTRMYVDSNGEEVVEEREYQLQSYYELQLSPAKIVDMRKNKGSSQEVGRTRYYY